MKHYLTFFLACVTAVCVAQDESGAALKQNILKIAPQQFRVKSLKIGLERFNKPHTASYSVNLILRKEKNNQIDNPTGYDGLGGEFHYKRYLKPLATYASRKGKSYTQGIYLGGFIQGHSFSGDEFYRYNELDPGSGQYVPVNYFIHESVGNWATGFTIGFQEVFWGTLTVDAYVGGGIQWSDVIRTGNEPPNYYYTSPTYGYTDPRFSGILPKVGAQIGIAL